MKTTKTVLIFTFLLVALFSSAQDEQIKTWQGKTYANASFFRLGSYSKERPTIFLEQNFQYRLNNRFSLGVGLGINLYPSLLALPIFINGQYHFRVKSLEMTLNQSYGKNIKVGAIFFNSNRYNGSLDVTIPMKNIQFVPAIGYNFLWDKYGGKNLSFYLGVGIHYPLKK